MTASEHDRQPSNGSVERALGCPFDVFNNARPLS